MSESSNFNYIVGSECKYEYAQSLIKTKTYMNSNSVRLV